MKYTTTAIILMCVAVFGTGCDKNQKVESSTSAEPSNVVAQQESAANPEAAVSEANDTNNNEVARYIATSDSSNSNGEYGGWIKTYNGSLAQIRGAGIDIDTVASTIDIHAQDVSINGDRSVNIIGVSIILR